MKPSAAFYLARKYGPTAVRYGRAGVRRFLKGYRGRYSARKGRSYLRGGKRGRTYGTARRYKSRAIGNRVGTSTSKVRHISNTNLQFRDGKVLHQLELTNIPFGVERDERSRLTTNISGFKLNLQLRNARTQPMMFNYALIAPRNGSTILTDDFFRSPGSERSINFSTNLTALDLDKYSINRDLYTVLMHKKVKLVASNNGSTYQANQGQNYAIRSHYCPLKRQIRFANTTVNMPESGHVFFVHWTVHFGDTSNTGVQPNAMQIAEDFRIYFRDPIN